MKKIILFLALLIPICTIQAQEQSEPESKYPNLNEIKLNGLFLIAGALDVSYEHILNDESGIGVSVLLPISEEVRNDIHYYISPYYRFYFGEKYASGFFVEGFGMLNSTNRNIDFFDEDEDDFRTDFALGFAIGGKWVNKRGFSIEVFGGIGRNLFNNEGTDYEIIGKGGVNFGYRF